MVYERHDFRRKLVGHDKNVITNQRFVKIDHGGDNHFRNLPQKIVALHYFDNRGIKSDRIAGHRLKVALERRNVFFNVFLYCSQLCVGKLDGRSSSGTHSPHVDTCQQGINLVLRYGTVTHMHPLLLPIILQTLPAQYRQASSVPEPLLSFRLHRPDIKTSSCCRRSG